MKCIIPVTFFTALAIAEVPKTSAVSSSLYAGIDTEDGSYQYLNIFCNDRLCDISLGDVSFSTCIGITGNILGGGVGIAKDIPEDSLDDFKIDLFCLQIGQLEIDIDNDAPTGTLTGNMAFLQDGSIRRTATGFIYFKLSNSGSSSYSAIANGKYYGIDNEDGSYQHLDVLCSSEDHCDIILSDFSFSTCIALTGTPFFRGGVGYAKNIPIDSLDNFKIDLFCLVPGQLEIDVDNDAPLGALTGDMMLLQAGILRRTGPGFTYFRTSTSEAQPYTISKSSRSNSSKKPSSVSKGTNFNGAYRATDTEDGSYQFLDVLCNDDVCDVTLSDIAFSTCAKINEIFLPGVGVARNISVHSLDDYDIDLFCLQPGQSEIDIENDVPLGTLTGDMVLLQDGVISRTGPGFTYMNVYTGNVIAENGNAIEHTITNGHYQGGSTEKGRSQTLIVSCSDGLCDIILGDVLFPDCFVLNGSAIYGGVGAAKNIPMDLLDDFDINIFCLRPDKLEIDIDIDSPSGTVTGNFMSIGFDGIIGRNGTDSIYFKTSSE